MEELQAGTQIGMGQARNRRHGRTTRLSEGRDRHRDPPGHQVRAIFPVSQPFLSTDYARSEKLALLSVENSKKLRALDSEVRKIVVTLSDKTPSEQITKTIADLTTHQRVQFRELLVSTLDSRTEFQALRRESQELAKTLITDFALATQRTDAQFGELRATLEADREGLAFQRGMSTALMREDNEKRLNRVRLLILESLRFDRMDDRPATVVKAHAKTFEWVFKDPAAGKNPWSDFALWLKRGSGIYWIKGKPGSGKSTLMKFIWSHALTSTYLREWAAGKQLLAAVFFFWNSGHQSQRSHEGLFRTLLYQVLSEEPSLLPTVFPTQWKRTAALAACDLDIEKEHWDTPGQLREAFEILVRLASAEMPLCFFIDGLDEAEGDVDDIADFVEQMALTSPHVKFCVSSRPWPTFEAIFAEVPSLRLQDLTVEDIRIYVADTLGANRSIQRILRHEPGKQQWLAEELVKMAMGVFLWVSLAVKLLVRGIHEGDDTEELHRRLLSLPPDLEKFYDHIFEQIQQGYPEESSKIFQLFRANGNTLDILMLSRALTYPEDSYGWVLWLKLVPKSEVMTSQYKTLRKHQVERWIRKLNSRCFGLLEIVDNNGEDEDKESRAPEPRQYFGGMAEAATDAYRSPPTFLGTPEARASQAQVLNKALSNSSTRRTARIRRSMRMFAPVKGFESTDDQVTIPIRYLHQTAQDYLEEPRVWGKLVSMTAPTTFDPYAALLLAWVITLKTSVLTSPSDRNAFPTDDIIGIVRNLAASAPQNLRTSILLEELHRAVCARTMDLRMVLHQPPSIGIGHTSDQNLRPVPGHMWRFEEMVSPVESWPRADLAAQLSGTEEWIYIADQRGVPVVFTSLDRGSSPALGVALFFSQWMAWLSLKPGSLPDPLEGSKDLFNTILANDSNAVHAEISGHTIWELVVHLVHVFHDQYHMSVDFSKWLGVVQLMLDSGADPHACCLEGDPFIQAVRLVREWAPPLEVIEHCQVPPGLSRVQRAHADHGWSPDDQHAYWHGVEAVVRDVFVRRGTKGADELLASVLEKKASRSKTDRRPVGAGEDGDGKGGDIPKWVS